MEAELRKTVVVAGASGFIGQAICAQLSKRFRVVALTRSLTHAADHLDETGVAWRVCDLFSLLETEQALRDADYAVYLVHSMLPSSRLTQGTFVDLDLILADNFARAARLHQIQQIIYLGGLIPVTPHLSSHLASRLEVEEALGSGSSPVTALRAGLVVGPGGSSLRILVNLVRRMPVLFLPPWAERRMQPVAIQDVVRAVDMVIGAPEYFGAHFDIGGPEVLTYRELLQKTARVLGCRRWMIPVPALPAKLLKAWVSLVGGASRALVGPLVDSLNHDMCAAPNPLLTRLAVGAIGFEQALRASLDGDHRLALTQLDQLRPRDIRVIRAAKRVRSVQRLPLPADLSAQRVALEYYGWLPRFVWPLLKCEVDESGHCRFYLGTRHLLLLELTYSHERSTADRVLFYITGGVLAKTANNRKGRLEFREMLNRTCVLAAIHDFTPTLPWYFYNLTQALVHLLVMRRFGRHLGVLHIGSKPKPGAA
ncbi:MAG: NAD(P)H-binding protein [Verrucomicrobia bacterium]|nr:NAD(P)H-binding protein [Verrucomicrobiota bacterium]